MTPPRARCGPARRPGRLRGLLHPRADDIGLVGAAPAVAPRVLARRFWPFARPYRSAIAAGLVLSTALPAIAVAEVWLFKLVIDDVIVPADVDALAWLIPAVLGLTLAGAALAFGEDYAWTWAGERFLLDLRASFFSHVQALGPDPLGRRLGDTLTRLNGDVQAIEGFVLGGLSELVSALARIVFVSAALFLLDWRLALVTLLVAPPFYVAGRTFARLARGAAREKRRRSGALTAVAEESLANAGLVQSCNAADRERARLVREGEGVVDAELTSVRVGGAFAGAVALIEVAGILTIVALGTWAIGSERLTIGGLLAFLAYLSQLLRPVGNLGHLASSLLGASAGGERVLELLDQRPRVRDRPGARPLDPVRGAIEMADVRFAYPGTPGPALDGVDLTIEPGEVVAVCGPSGAGKSTLARLIARGADPDAGAVRIDGRDLRDVTLASLRDNVGVLAQDTMLFDASVRDNVAFGRPDAFTADIEAAARAAGAHQFVAAFAQGYDTRIGQRGQRLSGGQRRRVEIARTLLRDTPIVILDEPTAGLDRAAADRLGVPLRELIRGRTAIVITHDPALARTADRVLYVEDGHLRAAAPGPLALEPTG